MTVNAPSKYLLISISSLSGSKPLVYINKGINNYPNYDNYQWQLKTDIEGTLILKNSDIKKLNL